MSLWLSLALCSGGPASNAELLGRVKVPGSARSLGVLAVYIVPESFHECRTYIFHELSVHDFERMFERTHIHDSCCSIEGLEDDLYRLFI